MTFNKFLIFFIIGLIIGILYRFSGFALDELTQLRIDYILGLVGVGLVVYFLSHITKNSS